MVWGFTFGRCAWGAGSHMLFIFAQLGTEGAMISYRHMPPEPVEAACDGWIQSPPVIAFCTKELSQECGVPHDRSLAECR